MSGSSSRSSASRAPWWRPDRFAQRRGYLEARGRIVEATRAYFRGLGFLEVETPALQVSPGLEPHLTAFRTELQEPGGAARPLYLHTSPEFAMKKLLAAGLERIFQLARVYRNAERSATHHPEFTMLEWYRAHADYMALMDDCEGLLRAAAAATGQTLSWQGRSCDATQPAERLTVADAFAREAGIDLLATAPDPHAPSLERLADAARRLSIAPRPGDRWDDLFFRIFFDHIEPKLGIGRPTILTEYPVSMAALSRPKDADPRVCERFELYVCGLELANAFGELTDPVEQRRRFEADMALKQRLYGITYPIDEDFIAALAHGFPPAAGIALGVDRLVMLATGAPHIEDVLWAPVAGAEEG
jgi:elongation factor P--(R)-beta-lysine ligase